MDEHTCAEAICKDPEWELCRQQQLPMEIFPVL